MGTGMGGDIYIRIYTGALHKSSPSSRIRSTGGTPTRLAACSWAYTCIYYAYIDDLKTRRKFAIRENYPSGIFSAKFLPAISDACTRSTGIVESYSTYIRSAGKPVPTFFSLPIACFSILLESSLRSGRSLRLWLTATRRRPFARLPSAIVV